jgi:hypothetical protein
VLQAFSQYYGEAMLEDVTDPNLIFDLRAKLDSAGHYDEFELERVVKAGELPPVSTGQSGMTMEGSSLCLRTCSCPTTIFAGSR